MSVSHSSVLALLSKILPPIAMPILMSEVRLSLCSPLFFFSLSCPSTLHSSLFISLPPPFHLHSLAIRDGELQWGVRPLHKSSEISR